MNEAETVLRRRCLYKHFAVAPLDPFYKILWKQIWVEIINSIQLMFIDTRIPNAQEGTKEKFWLQKPSRRKKGDKNDFKAHLKKNPPTPPLTLVKAHMKMKMGCICSRQGTLSGQCPLGITVGSGYLMLALCFFFYQSIIFSSDRSSFYSYSILRQVFVQQLFIFSLSPVSQRSF